jgi:zinc protease
VTPVSDASLQIFERPGSKEATLAIGTPVPGPGHEDAAALEIATILIGGGHASRLARADDVPFTASPYSLIASYRDASYWAAVTSTRATHAQPALQMMRRILDDLRSSPPDTAAVERAQIVLIDRFLLQSSTRDGLADQLMFLDRHGLSTNYFMTYQERIRSVTPNDVLRVVNTYLSPRRLTTVVTGPKRLLQPQLAPFRERIP